MTVYHLKGSSRPVVVFFLREIVSRMNPIKVPHSDEPLTVLTFDFTCPGISSNHEWNFSTQCGS